MPPIGRVNIDPRDLYDALLKLDKHYGKIVSGLHEEIVSLKDRVAKLEETK